MLLVVLLVVLFRQLATTGMGMVTRMVMALQLSRMRWRRLLLPSRPLKAASPMGAVRTAM